MTDQNIALKILSEMKELLASDSFIGKPVQMGDSIMMPLLKITVGFGGGEGLAPKSAKGDAATKSSGGGGGGGITITPIAVMTITNGKAECFAVPQQQSSVGSLLEKIPDFLSSFTHHEKSDADEAEPAEPKKKK